MTNEIPFPNYVNCAPNENNGCVKPKIPKELIALCKAAEFPQRRSEFFLNHNFIYREDKYTSRGANAFFNLLICISSCVLSTSMTGYIYLYNQYNRIVDSVGLTCVDIKRVELLEREEERKERLTTIRPILDDVYGTDITSVIADFYDS